MTRRRRRGFTLLEVVITLAVMAAAAVLVLPFVGGGLDTMRAASAARGVVAFLNEARNLAISAAVPQEVSFDQEERSFVRRTGREAGDEAEAEAEAVFSLSGGLSATRMGSREGDEGDYDTIVFYPLGDSTGGTVELADARGRRWTVTVGVLFAAPKLTRRQVSD